MQSHGVNNKEVKLTKIRLAYLVDLSQQVLAFGAWLDAGDFAAAAKNAHRIKGTAGTYKLGDIAAVMGEIEQLALTGDAAAIADKLTDAAGFIEMQRRLTEQACQELQGKPEWEETDG